MAVVERDCRVALEKGKKEGFVVGYEAGIAEGRLSYLGLHDFMKAPSFKDIVETKAIDFLIESFEKCHSQLQKLNRFAEGSDRTKLDLSLNGDLEPYPTKP
ncbi:UNVERIFIED_CONTAM: hypothetical protein Sindi_0536100 [Sesamum indicum]